MNTEIAQGEYITKQELCVMCGISKSTAYKLLKTKKIRFEKCHDGLLHYYKIPVSDAIAYMQEKANHLILTENQTKIRRQYYKNKMQLFPDVIEAKDIRAITGYGKETIRNWINSEKILGVISRKRFKVAKEDLLDFLVSPYYETIIRKSKTHLADCAYISKLER